MTSEHAEGVVTEPVVTEPLVTEPLVTEPVVVDLVAEELRELAAVVVGDADRISEPLGVYYLAPEDEASRLARVVEAAVFDRYFDNTPAILAAEYERYEPAELFVCVVDHRRLAPAGMMRLTLGSPLGLKTLDDIRDVWGRDLDAVYAATGIALDAMNAWDVTTIAVADDYRGLDATGDASRPGEALVSLALYYALAQALIRHRVAWLLSIMDLIPLELVQIATRGVFDRFTGIEPVEYLGSAASVAVQCDIDTYLARMGAHEPDVDAFLRRGAGLEGLVAPLRFETADAVVGRVTSLRAGAS